MVQGKPLRTPPRSTALGALAYYVSHANPSNYQPTNVTFGIVEPLARAPRNKLARKTAVADRALRDLDEWQRGDRSRPDALDVLKAGNPYV